MQHSLRIVAFLQNIKGKFIRVRVIFKTTSFCLPLPQACYLIPDNTLSETAALFLVVPLCETEISNNEFISFKSTRSEEASFVYAPILSFMTQGKNKRQHASLLNTEPQNEIMYSSLRFTQGKVEMLKISDH